MIHGNHVARSCSRAVSGAGGRGHFTFSGACTIAANDFAGRANGRSQLAVNGPGEHAVGNRPIVSGELTLRTGLLEISR